MSAVKLKSLCKAGCLRTIVGLDVGGSKIALVEGTRHAQILQRRIVPIDVYQPFDDAFPTLAASVEEVIQKAEDDGRIVAALSVSIGGPLRINDGVLLDPPHLPGWHNTRLKDRLRERFPRFPVYIEHDGNAGALAEFHFGIGRQKPNLRHLVFLTFGTGLGAGLIINGQVVHGASDTAGELGHWRLTEVGPFGYGKIGAWEALASGTGLVQLASRRFPSRWSVSTPIRHLVDAMLADDPQALIVAAEAGAWMGRGLALIVDALNPEVIVLGSLAVLLGDRVLATAREVVAKEALPRAMAACEIAPAVLGLQIGDVAALMAALSDSATNKALSEQEHEKGHSKEDVG
jgi:glucokinase